jgi:hypothetical protein
MTETLRSCFLILVLRQDARIRRFRLLLPRIPLVRGFRDLREIPGTVARPHSVRYGARDTYLLRIQGFDKEVVIAKKEFVREIPILTPVGDK